MRKVHIEDGLAVRFPGRDREFADGVEIGMLATLMASGLAEFSRTVASVNVEQARKLAQRLGYLVEADQCHANGMVRLTARRSRRAHLRIVAAS
jgi:hypothetical protein